MRHQRQQQLRFLPRREARGHGTGAREPLVQRCVIAREFVQEALVELEQSLTTVQIVEGKACFR
jgi:hypothetical protein